MFEQDEADRAERFVTKNVLEAEEIERVAKDKEAKEKSNDKV